MSEQTDKPLHDWVRQSLDTYRPDYNPTDWATMKRLLQRKRWWRGGLISSVVLCLSSWLVMNPQTDKPVSPKQWSFKHKRPNPVLPHTLELTENQPITRTNQASSLLIPKFGSSNKTRLTRSGPVVSSVIAPMTVIREIKPFSTALTDQIPHSERVAFSSEERAITQQMLTGEFGTDSTSYHTLDRNLHRWPNAVIVCDMTTSMYPYTTQLFAWLKQQVHNPTIKGMVFFTDCDSLGRETQVGGPAGQMFITRERNPVNVLPILLTAARNTVHNNDDAENDIEALIAAQKTFPEAKHFVLLADNMSTVKDLALLNQVKKPVHVVLCGTTGGNLDMAFQPDYYTIASRTRGSIHTLEDDLDSGEISSKSILRVGTTYYRYIPRKKKFKRTAFDHRPKRFLKSIWL